ncbi:MAG: hypothetical protein VYB77_03505 [Planctomycetota bacterium]|nr:hypothetical protein [Planctomycetota bacterium]MEC8818655.1 hypothetical protein [Planctomycetota bacterium]MEC9157177.1 hypothetical protein [Planctomycetota bacterium]MED6307471.1 hypothetical protein [Planctomycetota bacterium]
MNRCTGQSRLLASMLALPLVIGFAGCDGDRKNRSGQPASATALQRDELNRIDRWAVEAPLAHSVDNAVITQRILYDYHFEAGGSRLTVVGRRDALTMARHYRGSDWELSVRPGSAGPELYAARVKVVRELMQRQGVADDELAITDGTPGGAGLPASDARRIRAESLKGAGSLRSGDPYSDDGRLVQPMDTPLEGGS